MEGPTGPSPVLDAPELTQAAARIAVVADRLFYSRGIHSVGVDTIAAESGITKRTLYNRFGSKDQLVVTYLQRRHQAWVERMQQSVARHPEAPVVALFDSYLPQDETTNRGCAFVNAAGELGRNHPGHAVVQAHKQAAVNQIMELVQDTGGPGRQEVAEEIFLLLEGAIVHRGIDQDAHRSALARKLVARLAGEAETA